MRRKSKTTQLPTALLQLPGAWCMAVRKLHTWVEEEHPLSRPCLVLLVDKETLHLVGADILSQAPDADEALRFILRTMTRPAQGSGQKAHRPQHIQFEQAELAQWLGAPLAEISIATSVAPPPPEVDRFIADYESMLYGEAPNTPSLLSIEGVTPELAGDLFTAAANFYRKQPWKALSDEQPLALHFSPPGKQGYCILMGQGGQEFGLLLFWRWKEIEQTYRFSDDPLEHLAPEGWRGFSFESADILPSEDLDAIEKYGWEIAGEQAYPFPATYTHDEVLRPSRQELIYYQAALRAIPHFVEQALRPGAGDAVQATFNISTHDGPMTVDIRYPAGELPILETDAVSEELESQAETPVFGEEAATPLGQAQQLMYLAWEERSPARRIQTARQALKLSPDCADAYVLLAEEAAKTAEQACRYYRKGMLAAERTLGELYFKELAGNFWNLRETRPYMRARQGLAECLVDTGHPEEALEHYRDMLRLNPDDHQGIRYALLNLLLQMGRENEAETLLERYPEDIFAAWPYTRTLLVFRRTGASPEAEAALAEATRANPHVHAYLTGSKTMPETTPEAIGFGDENEAAIYAAEHFNFWWQTPGAVAWLKQKRK